MGQANIPPENWPVLSRLLDEALELSPVEREQWLADLPEEYAAVKPWLERLLARASQVLSGGLLQDLPAFDREPGMDTAGRAPVAGEALGSWRLLRMVGEGGMASVWLAERLDGAFGGPVALKLPHQGSRAGRLSEHLEREREILATLHHPNIARLLDAGILATGQPYLALEYVEGMHIDEYCRGRQLGLEPRLALFLQIAHAVAHAHNMLIIHRDLKPSNILVTGDAQVRLLDFGIAKLMDNGEARETRLTRLSGRALTVDYASPEQIAGRPVTVASDVYSLGVVLYELLADVRPYKLKWDSQAALEEAILEVEPRPPSEMAAQKARARALRGDLDTIVLKALKKAPAERYSSVEAFAEDIKRYTLNLPVRAQPDRKSYLLSKFIRRNRLAVAAAATVLITLLAGSGLVVWQELVALAQQRRAEEIKSFLVSTLLGAHAYWAGRPLSALELLHRVESHVYRLRGADAETRVELLNILAASMLSLQDTAGAESTAISAVRESTTLEPGHPQALRAHMLRNWVRLFRGQYPEGRAEIDQLVLAMRRSPRTLPEDLAGALRIRSDLALEEGNFRLAESSALEALQIADDRLGPHHNQTVLALVELSLAYQAGGKVDAALEIVERAKRRALEAYSGQLTHPNVLKARSAYSQILAASGQRRLAIAEAELVMNDNSQLFGPSSRAVGLDLRNLARLQLDAGQLAPALQSADRAVSILREHFDPGSPGYGALIQLRGLIRLAAGRHAGALLDLTRSEEIAERWYDAAHPTARAARAHRALALARTGRLQEAQRILESEWNGAALPAVCLPYYLGIVKRLAGRHKQALELQEEALRALPVTPAAETPRMLAALEIGLNYRALGRAENAARALSPVANWCRETSRLQAPYCEDALGSPHLVGK